MLQLLFALCAKLYNNLVFDWSFAQGIVDTLANVVPRRQPDYWIVGVR